MANKLIMKKSSVAAKVPLATDIDVGELAINLTDQKLYSKKADGTVILVGSGLGGAGDVQGPASSTDNAIVRFDATTGKLIQNSSVIIKDDGNLITSAAIAIGVADPISQIHTGGATGSEWIIEQTGAKPDYRKWNFVVANGNSTTPPDFILRLLNDAGTAASGLAGFGVNGATGKFSTAPRMIDPASVPPGSIIQAKWIDMGGGNWSAVTGSYANSGFGGTITPQFSTSKIIHIVTVGVVALCDGSVVIARNGTIVSPSLADNFRTIGSWDWYNDMAPLCFTWMDSPGTTSATNYNLYGRASGCGNSIVIGSSSDFTTSWLMLEVAA